MGPRSAAARSLRRFVPGKVRSKLRELQFAVRSFVYRGDRVFCPCCQRRFRTFLWSQRPAALCPGCGSLERHRLLRLYLEQRTNFFAERIRFCTRPMVE